MVFIRDEHFIISGQRGHGGAWHGCDAYLELRLLQHLSHVCWVARIVDQRLGQLRVSVAKKI